MALVKLGGGVTAISGSIAGNTFARNRFGAYMRARTKPINPRSDRQVAARARVAYLAEEWSATLTGAQRLAWESYAMAISWLNKLGEAVKLTGFNHFIRSNSARLMCGMAVEPTGPTVLSLPNADPLFSCALSEANGITIIFDDTFDWCDEDNGALFFQIGTPQLASRTFFNGPWRVGGLIAGNVAVPPTTPYGPAPVTAWTLTETQLAWCQARILREDGRLTNYFGQGAVTVGA